jgi:hypothetical protein
MGAFSFDMGEEAEWMIIFCMGKEAEWMSVFGMGEEAAWMNTALYIDMIETVF